jgi:hypothetical protein
LETVATENATIAMTHGDLTRIDEKAKSGNKRR